MTELSPRFLSETEELAYHQVHAKELGDMIFLIAVVLRKRKIMDEVDEEPLDTPESNLRAYWCQIKLGRDLGQAVQRLKDEYERLACRTTESDPEKNKISL